MTPQPWTITSAGGLVPWQRDLVLPARFGAVIDDDRLPFRVEIEVRVHNRRPTCSKLTLLQREGGDPVTSRELRGVQLTRYLAVAAAQCALRMERLPDGSVAVEPMLGEVVLVNRTDVEAARQGRRPLTDEHLRNVARLYRAAVDGGKSTREAINAEMPAATSTIGRWVQEARARGFLGEATPRRAGEVAKKEVPTRKGKS